MCLQSKNHGVHGFISTKPQQKEILTEEKGVGFLEMNGKSRGNLHTGDTKTVFTGWQMQSGRAGGCQAVDGAGGLAS